MQQYNTHKYGLYGHPTMPRFLDELEKDKRRSVVASSCRGRKLEGETIGHFCWWRQSFKYQEPKEEIEHVAEGM